MMMAELAESESVYSLLPCVKKSKFLRDCAIAFGCRKGQKQHLVAPSSELYPVFGGKNPISSGKKALFNCIGDQDWSNSRLHWLDIVQ